MRPTRVEQRGTVVGVMLLSGAEPKEVSETLNIAQSTVYMINKKHDET